MKRAGTAAYVAPFAVFIGFLAIHPIWPVPQWARLFVELTLIAIVSRSALSSQPKQPWLSAWIGLGVFLIWIGPEMLIIGYRSMLPFHNAIVGGAIATTTFTEKRDPAFLAFRILNSAVTIPVLEELFWRGFLMRWLIRQDFQSIPLGTWNASSFWLVAALFASEHGSYWDVGLISGLIYNLWMLRTGNLWDCIIAHSVTNSCLAVFVVGTRQWQFWM